MRNRAVLLLAALWLATGCGGNDAADDVTVLAAASLTDAFGEIAAGFEDANPGVTVSIGFAGSSTLAAQILAGAPADVFAAADTRTMDRLVEAGAVGGPVPFATNRMVVVVPAGEGSGITGVADLARPGVSVALCAPEVPCGVLAEEVFANAGIAVPEASREVDVRAVLARVELGEVDAGIVYETDAALAGGRVDRVEIPDAVNAATMYPIARLAGAGEAAAAFVDFVTSEPGRTILAGYGFGPP